MSTPKIPTPEAGDTPGDEIPSFSPSARESASKCRERTDACSGDTLTPGDKISSQTLAFAAVTADVTESPEGGAEPDRPVEEPTRAPAAVSQHQAFPSFMRRYIDMASASGPEMDQPRPPPNAHFVPRILREVGWAVTPPITPSQAPPASVTPTVTAAPIAGSVCPTCHRRVPLNSAERQRAYRKRQREQRQGLAGDLARTCTTNRC
jgi:hypothetical protein